jgi:hypothetical protein
VEKRHHSETDQGLLRHGAGLTPHLAAEPAAHNFDPGQRKSDSDVKPEDDHSTDEPKRQQHIHSILILDFDSSGSFN